MQNYAMKINNHEKWFEMWKCEIVENERMRQEEIKKTFITNAFLCFKKDVLLLLRALTYYRISMGLN